MREKITFLLEDFAFCSTEFYDWLSYIKLAPSYGITVESKEVKFKVTEAQFIHFGQSRK